MEDQILDFLNIYQEDDNLLEISPSNAESLLVVSTLSPCSTPKSLKQASIVELGNCHGKDETVGAPALIGTDLNVTMVPVACLSPKIPSSVVSVLNCNEMNKRRVNQDNIESWSRNLYGVKEKYQEILIKNCHAESTQLDGIAETSSVNNTGIFTSQLSRSYLDIENEQAGMTSEKSGGDPIFLRKSRSRLSVTLRKSLAWDKAFFTEEGVLDNDELFEVASDAPKKLIMPELATIWDGPRICTEPCEAKTTPSKNLFKSKLRTEPRLELRPDVRLAVDPNSKQVAGILHTSLRPETLHSSSLRPVRQFHTSGSHNSSNAYSVAAATAQGSTSTLLPISLSGTGKELGAAGRNLIENSQGTGSGLRDQPMRELRNIATALHHQARKSALKKTHESPLLKGPRVRLPKSIFKMKVEDKHYEVIQKAKQPKKVDYKHLEDVLVFNLSKKLEARSSDQMQQMKIIHKTQPELTRSLSASGLLDSSAADSRKVSLMSKKVKETLGKVMAGRARSVPMEPLFRVFPVGKDCMPSKESNRLRIVAEVENRSHRTKFNVAAVPVKLSKEICTGRDILRENGTHSSPMEAFKQCPNLMRYKSACGVPGLPRATDPGLVRIIAPSAPPPPPPAVRPSEPTGLRKPSPKLGFFDVGKATSGPLRLSTISPPLQDVHSGRPGCEISTLTEPLGHWWHEHPDTSWSSAKISSIPSAPHLRRGVMPAPNSARGISSSPECNLSPTFPKIGNADRPLILSGTRYVEQSSGSHQLLASKILIEDVSSTVPEAFTVDCFQLPDGLSTYAELNVEPAEDVQDVLTRRSAKSNLSTLPSFKFEDPPYGDFIPESIGAESVGNSIRRADLIGMEYPNRSCEFGYILTENHSVLGITYDNSELNATDSESSIVGSKSVFSFHVHPDTSRSSASSKASKDNNLSASTCPRTPASKDCSHDVGSNSSKQFNLIRRKSIEELSCRTNTSIDLPEPASKTVVRSYSQRVSRHSLGDQNIGDSSPGFSMFTSGKPHNVVSPSHPPDSAGIFEVLTPSSKIIRGFRPSGSSRKKGIRKLLRFGSSSSQWSNWPILGAAISADSLPGSFKEGWSSVPPKHLGEQATGSRSKSSTCLQRTFSLERVSDEQRSSTLEQSIDLIAVLCTPANAITAEVVRNPSLGSNGAEAAEAAEACPLRAASVEKEQGASMFTFARKAVRRLTSAPASADSAQESEGTSRSSCKTSRRFSETLACNKYPGPEPMPLSLFSEARICELEAAGPEVLEKKSGPVQNSPPDKVVIDTNPWSPVRKNGQPLGPFDCTKLKCISPGPTS